jgi:archaellum component FlaC
MVDQAAEKADTVSEEIDRVSALNQDQAATIREIEHSVEGLTTDG